MRAIRAARPKGAHELRKKKGGAPFQASVTVRKPLRGSRRRWASAAAPARGAAARKPDTFAGRARCPPQVPVEKVIERIQIKEIPG